MFNFIRVADHKMWIGGHRLHHGLLGCGIIMLGLIIAVHDCRDLSKWIPDFLLKV